MVILISDKFHHNAKNTLLLETKDVDLIMAKGSIPQKAYGLDMYTFLTIDSQNTHRTTDGPVILAHFWLQIGQMGRRRVRKQGFSAL